MVPPGLIFINFIFQRLLRISKELPFPVNFTSRVVAGNRIKLLGIGARTVASFSLSGGCYIQALNGIELGDGIRFGPGVKIISSNHDIQDLDRALSGPPIKIGDNVWIGANAVILPEVEIGNNCVIGAGSVVTRSFKGSNLIIAGNPARRVRTRK